MALPGTHIRFALDMATNYPIETFEHYISGTIYPDSRWLTSIDRDRTHGKRFIKKDFADSDFTRGWQVHCVCDGVQRPIYDRLLPYGGSPDDDQRWVRQSAAKMVQDMHDITCFALEKYLPALEYARAPYAENVDLVQKFNTIVRKAYTSENGPGLDEYRTLWLDIGLSPILTAEVIAATKKIMTDPSLVERINAAYDEMIYTAYTLIDLGF